MPADPNAHSPTMTPNECAEYIRLMLTMSEGHPLMRMAAELLPRHLQVGCFIEIALETIATEAQLRRWCQRSAAQLQKAAALIPEAN